MASVDRIAGVRFGVLGAIAAGWALQQAGCQPRGESAPAPAPLPLPSASSAPVAPMESTATATATATPTVPVPEPVPAAPLPPCTAPTTLCVPRFPPPPPESYDKNGCLPRESIGGSCSGRVAVAGPTVFGNRCCYSVCQGPVPPCGRPLVVGGSPRVAALATRDDWLASRGTPNGSLVRDELRAAWLADAVAEHASVASFARFALDLLAVGAPSELVAAAHRAALDEVEHARACFALAAAYGDTSAASGPGPLAMDGVAVRAGLPEIVAAAVIEGCIGETLAALVASRARELCEDPAVAEALATIARDEQRHAELGFCFVAWALAAGDAETATSVARAFERGLRDLDAIEGPQPTDVAAWRAAGRLDRAELAAVVRDARRELLQPAAALLLQGLSGSSGSSRPAARSPSVRRPE